MEKLNKKELQLVWDSCLLNAAMYEKTMSYVLTWFVERIDGVSGYETSGQLDLVEAKERVLAMDLRRCVDVDRHGNKVLYFATSKTLSFIFSHSPKMAASIVKSRLSKCVNYRLRDFKWKKQTITMQRLSRSNRKSRNKKIGSPENRCRIIYARNCEVNSGKHSWRTTS